MAYAQPYASHDPHSGPAHGHYDEYSANPYAAWDTQPPHTQQAAPAQDSAQYGYAEQYNGTHAQHSDPYGQYGDGQAHYAQSQAQYGAAHAPYGDAHAQYGGAHAQYGNAHAQYGGAHAQYGDAHGQYGDANTYAHQHQQYGESSAHYQGSHYQQANPNAQFGDSHHGGYAGAMAAPQLDAVAPTGHQYAENPYGGSFQHQFELPSRPGTAPGSFQPGNSTSQGEVMPNFSAAPPPTTNRGAPLHAENGEFPLRNDAGAGGQSTSVQGQAPSGQMRPRRPDLNRTQSNDTYRSDPGPGNPRGPARSRPPGGPPGAESQRGPPRDPRGGTSHSSRRPPPPGSRGPPPPGARAPPSGSRDRAPRSRGPPGAESHDPRTRDRDRERSRGPPRGPPGPGNPRSGSRPPGARNRPAPGPEMPNGSRTRPGPAGMPPRSATASGNRAEKGGGQADVLAGSVGASTSAVQAAARRNSDALPAHPAPVRPGLQQDAGSKERAPPVRNYTGQTPSSTVTPLPRAPERPPPVTHEELAKLRQAVQSRPSDFSTRLELAKKLVEAAHVLADEDGKADVRTRNKNRERYVYESHDIVKQLVSQDFPDAQFYLADCMGSGVFGIPNDAKTAFGLYQAAAKAGHAQAAYRTALCCELGPEDGGGTRRDTLKAFQWYKRAAALGDQPSMYKVAMIQLRGLLGQERNMHEGVTWLRRAVEFADDENPHALHELACLYDPQAAVPRAVEPDDRKSLELFMQAAGCGFKHSQFRLGQAYEYGLLGCSIDARNSIVWYTKAAAQGEHQSELALSGWYLTGADGILEHSDTEAYLWARKAALAEPPLAKAMFALGYYTEVGIGCPRSLEEAKRWYSRAASHKFPRAQERLEELKRGGSKVQKSREPLSRQNQRQQEAECSVM